MFGLEIEIENFINNKERKAEMSVSKQIPIIKHVCLKSCNNNNWNA